MSDDAEGTTHPSAYQVCVSCKEDRAHGRFDEDSHCRSCDGSGMVRDP